MFEQFFVSGCICVRSTFTWLLVCSCCLRLNEGKHWTFDKQSLHGITLAAIATASSLSSSHFFASRAHTHSAEQELSDTFSIAEWFTGGEFIHRLFLMVYLSPLRIYNFDYCVQIEWVVLNTDLELFTTALSPISTRMLQRYVLLGALSLFVISHLHIHLSCRVNNVVNLFQNNFAICIHSIVWQESSRVELNLNIYLWLSPSAHRRWALAFAQDKCVDGICKFRYICDSSAEGKIISISIPAHRAQYSCANEIWDSHTNEMSTTRTIKMEMRIGSTISIRTEFNLFGISFIGDVKLNCHKTVSIVKIVASFVVVSNWNTLNKMCWSGLCHCTAAVQSIFQVRTMYFIFYSTEKWRRATDWAPPIRHTSLMRSMILQAEPRAVSIQFNYTRIVSICLHGRYSVVCCRAKWRNSRSVVVFISIAAMTKLLLLQPNRIDVTAFEVNCLRSCFLLASPSPTRTPNAIYEK